MELVYDGKENKEGIYSLWQTVFQDSEAFAAYYFQWVYSKNQVIVAKEGTEIRSMLHLNPYRWQWNDGGDKETVLDLHYIVGVATALDFRRQGFMADCMIKALQDMERNGEPFTYLMPANKAYYEPFQFVALKAEKRWRPQEHPELVWNYQMYPVRSAGYKSRLKAEMQCENGDIIEWNGGYCAYVIDRREAEKVAILEQIFLYDANKDSNIEPLLWKEVYPELYRRYGRIPIEIMESQVMMIRVLNLQRFVELLPYEKETQQLVVHVTDSICTGNSGIYRLILSPKGCKMERLNKQEPLQQTESDFISEYHWTIAELTAYLLVETKLAEKMYLMEIV